MRKTAKWLVIAMLVVFAATPVQTGWAQEAACAEPDAEQATGMECEPAPEVQELPAKQAQQACDEAEPSEPTPSPEPEAQAEPLCPAETAAPDAADVLPVTAQPTDAPTPTPEATLAPEATAVPEEETAPAAPAEEVGTDLSNIQITVWLDWEGPLHIGDTVLLKSRIDGLQPDSAYTLQWQYFDGSQWSNEPGATADACSITVTETNAGYLWRLAVQAA